ncbi:lipase/esterase [Rhodopirellula islandica]|uniref:Lipase/esterase n=1 Tax=Rhodopirellula islandica TaxID=595434 RepID=A0A0J1BHZ6_RHOIS|nr:alpha/beta hydrolase [Rhodopirellula islandica]KLU06170.1 lipase/esterase [Rhodopirellula islandica]
MAVLPSGAAWSDEGEKTNSSKIIPTSESAAVQPASVQPASVDSAAEVGAVAVAATDQGTPVEVQQFLDLRYSDADGSAGLFDLHLPISDQHRVSTNDAGEVFVEGAPRPAILMIHGGGWAIGDKWTLRAYCDRLAQLGFVVLNMNYRLAPQHQFPRQVDDVRQALLQLVEHSDAWKIDLNRVGMFGYSAGGHLSALIGVLSNEDRPTQMLASEWGSDDPRWEQLPPIAAVCAGGPPCDFRIVPDDNAGLSYFLGGTPREVPNNYLGASPTAHVSPGDPPMQLIHGEKDLLVPLENSEKFAAALMDAGVAVSLTVIENQGHMMTLFHPTTKQQIKDFFVKQLLQP